MRNLTLPLLMLALSGCHFFQNKPAGEEFVDLSSTDGRKIASSEAGRALYAKYDKEISVGKCSAEVQQKLRVFGAERSWTKAPSQLDGSSTYVSPTRRFGHWVGVRKYQSGELQFLEISKGQFKIHSYSDTCSSTDDVRNRDFTRSSKPETGPEFTDKDLEKLMERTESYGVIYVWSPGMGYSYSKSIDPGGGYGHTRSGVINAKEAMEEVQKVTGKTMTFTALVDPFSPRALVDKIYAAGNHDLTPEMLKRMASFDLQMRSMGQHYPSLLVYGNGRIFRQMRPGLTTAESYRKYIEDAVKALQQ